MVDSDFSSISEIDGLGVCLEKRDAVTGKMSRCNPLGTQCIASFDAWGFTVGEVKLRDDGATTRIGFEAELLPELSEML